jgi:hypothetical protein
MSKQQNQAGKYVVHHAVQSAIGDYAKVENYLSAEAAAGDPGVAALRRLFEDVNRRLAALEAEDREQVAVEVEQAAKLAAQIQQGDESLKKQGFLETRLRNIVAMAPEIGQVIVATLAEPAAGIALALQKIAQKARSEPVERS